MKALIIIQVTVNVSERRQTVLRYEEHVDTDRHAIVEGRLTELILQGVKPVSCLVGDEFVDIEKLTLDISRNLKRNKSK